MVQQIDRKSLKQDVRELMRDAQVSPKGMVTLYLGLLLVLDMVTMFSGDIRFLSTFLSILTSLVAAVLSAGFVLYCTAIRRGERAEYLTLFDGFSFAGKIILLNLIVGFLTGLWASLFIIPGIIAHYRYRFALFNLYENPELGILEALRMSSQQTRGYKRQLFMLDISYLGWIILASVPNLIYSGLVYGESFRLATAYMQNPTGAFPVLDPSVLILPDWAWTLIAGVWALAAALFYLPQRRCVELAYFDIAKSSSAETTPTLPDSWDNDNP